TSGSLFCIQDQHNALISLSQTPRSRVAHQLRPSSLEQLFLKQHAISVSRDSDSVTRPEQQSHGMRPQGVALDSRTLPCTDDRNRPG
ncbi:mCG144548, partial [Mus musculus]